MALRLVDLNDAIIDKIIPLFHQYFHKVNIPIRKCYFKNILYNIQNIFDISMKISKNVEMFPYFCNFLNINENFKNMKKN